MATGRSLVTLGERIEAQIAAMLLLGDRLDARGAAIEALGARVESQVRCTADQSPSPGEG